MTALPDYDLAYPIRFDGTGRLAGAPNAEHVEQMIELALLTAPGERVNRPDFGAGLIRLVFEGGPAPGAALQLDLRAYLQRQFRTILTIDDLDLQRDGDVIDIAVNYRLADGRRVARYRYEAPTAVPPQPLPADPSDGEAAKAAIDPLTVLDHHPLPWIHYIARDYDSFRGAMLDRLAAQIPSWTERNSADPGVTVVEALAYAADYLSYRQDAVGAESRLSSARLRRSVTRHARLRDVPIDEGCNARVWVRISVAGPRAFPLPAGVQLLTWIGEIGLAFSSKSPELALCLDRTPDIFLTMHDAVLHPELEHLPLIGPAGEPCTLPAGSTSAVLAGHVAPLAAGDALLLESIARDAPDAPALRQIVRLRRAPVHGRDGAGRAVTHIHWHREDALTFDLPIATRDNHALHEHLAVARGNLVLADQGDIVEYVLPDVPEDGTYQPFIDDPQLVWSVPFDADQMRTQAASAALVQRSERSVAALAIEEVGRAAGPPVRQWQSRRDLLGSGRFAADVVVERCDGGVALRFGDDEFGRRPRLGSRLIVRYRRAAQDAGAVGAGAIGHLVTDHQALRAAITAVGNPIASTAPVRPQSIEDAKRMIAARAGRSIRCVLAGDVATLLARQPGVADVEVQLRVTSDRRTFIARVLPSAVSPLLDEAFARQLERLVEPHLTIGTGINVRGPDLVPLDLGLEIEMGAHVNEARVRAGVASVLGDGPGALFGPARRQLGAPVLLADILAAVAAVRGVADVRATQFRNLDRPALDGILTGVIACPPDAVAVAAGTTGLGLGRTELRFLRGGRA